MSSAAVTGVRPCDARALQTPPAVEVVAHLQVVSSQMDGAALRPVSAATQARSHHRHGCGWWTSSSAPRRRAAQQAIRTDGRLAIATWMPNAKDRHAPCDRPYQRRRVRMTRRRTRSVAGFTARLISAPRHIFTPLVLPPDDAARPCGRAQPADCGWRVGASVQRRRREVQHGIGGPASRVSPISSVPAAAPRAGIRRVQHWKSAPAGDSAPRAGAAPACRRPRTRRSAAREA